MNIPESEEVLEKAAGAPQLAEPAQAVSRFLPLAMATALFMDLLDTSALGSALPTLAREFHTEPLHLKLALTAYLMTMAILVPASGWLADRYGARRVFVNAVKVYLFGSMCCGLSNSITQLVTARILQGIGGAMMTPVARLIVVASTPREKLIQAMNAFTMPAVIGPMLGPPLAGVLLEIASWRWIFFINLPVGLLGIVAVLRIVPRLRHRHPGPFDHIGFIITGVAITTVIVLSESVGSGLLSRDARLLVAAISLTAWVVLIRHALTARLPMLDLRLLATPTYRASMIGGSLLRLSIGATPFLVPLLLQVALGWSPIKAGMVMMAITAGSILARFCGTYAVRAAGFRSTLIVTAGLTALFGAAPALFGVDSSALFIGAMLLGAGFFRAAHYVASSSIAFAEIKLDQVSRASTLSTVVQQVTLSLGVSFAGLTLYFSAGNGGLTTRTFVLPFVALGLTSLAAIPFYWGLTPDAGAHMRNAGRM